MFTYSRFQVYCAAFIPIELETREQLSQWLDNFTIIPYQSLEQYYEEAKVKRKENKFLHLKKSEA